MALFPLDASLGLILGTFQGIVLKRYVSIHIVVIWILASGLAYPVAELTSGYILHNQMGLVFGFYRSDLSQALSALFVVGFSAGFVISAVQALVLLQLSVTPWRWIGSSIVGFTVAIAVEDFLAVPEALFFSAIGALIGFVLGGGIYAFLTGHVLRPRLVEKKYDELCEAKLVWSKNSSTSGNQWLGKALEDVAHAARPDNSQSRTARRTPAILLSGGCMSFLTTLGWCRISKWGQ